MKAPDLEFFARRLREARRDNGTLHSFRFGELCVLVSSLFPFEPDIPDREKYGAAWRGLADAAKSREISAKSVEQAIRKAERHFLDAPAMPYTLVTSVTLPLPAKIQRRHLLRHTLTLTRHLPKALAESRSSADLNADQRAEFAPFHTPLLARVSGRSVHEAAELALHRIDFLRGVWNYSLNRRTLTRTSSPFPTPINSIRLGQVHTLHHADGSLVESTYWYDPRYDSTPHGAISPEEGQAAQRFFLRVQRRLRRIPYQPNLEAAFVRYGRALDDSDMESVFLKLWAVLESLTATKNARYETTIKRTAFLYKDRELTRYVLEHLRLRRNAAVHAGESASEAETIAYQIKHYTESLLGFHLGNGFRFKTMEEFGEYLDSPTDPLRVREQLRRLRLAAKYLGH